MSKLKQGAVCIIQNDKGEILLLNRNTAPFGWGLPGGKVDPGETHKQTVVREVWEEVGIQYATFEVMYLGSAESWYKKDGEDSGMVVHVYIAAGSYENTDGVIETHTPVLNFREHNEYKWVPKTELYKVPLAGNTAGFLALAGILVKEEKYDNIIDLVRDSHSTYKQEGVNV